MENPTSSTSPQWDETTKRIVAIIAFVLLCLAVFRLGAIIPIIFVSVVVAYLLHPLTVFIYKRILRQRLQPLAVLLTILLVISILGLSVIVLVPALFEQIQSFVTSLPTWLTNARDSLDTALNEPFLLPNGEEVVLPGSESPLVLRDLFGGEPLMGEDEFFSTIDLLLAQLEDLDPVAISQTLLNSIGGLTGPAFGFVGGAVRLVLNTIFLLTMIFYLLKDGPQFVDAIVNIAPRGYQYDTRRLLNELARVWNSYLRGQVILSLIMGFAMYLMAIILGLPNPLILGLIAGFLEFIPNIGPALAMVPAATIALFSTSSTIGLSGVPFMLTVIMIWTVLQQTEAVVLIPRIVGSSLNLHPFVVILAVIGGASLGGIFGVLIAAPVVASIRLVAQYVYGKLMDVDPFPVKRSIAEVRKQRRPVLVRLGDAFARWVRGLVSNRIVTRRS